MERELMYGIDAMWIAAALLVALLLAIDGGFRLGRRRERAESAPAKAHLNAIQASMLGILALLLGFTFSSALERFEARSQAVVASITNGSASGSWWTADKSMSTPGPDQSRRTFVAPSNMPRSERSRSLPRL